MPVQNILWWALFLEWIALICLGIYVVDLSRAHNKLVDKLLDNHAIELEEEGE